MRLATLFLLTLVYRGATSDNIPRSGREIPRLFSLFIPLQSDGDSGHKAFDLEGAGDLCQAVGGAVQQGQGGF